MLSLCMLAMRSSVLDRHDLLPSLRLGEQVQGAAWAHGGAPGPVKLRLEGAS